MNASEDPEDRPSLSDEALVLELKHWGENEPSGPTTRASDIQRTSEGNSRRVLQRTLVAACLVVIAILAVPRIFLQKGQVSVPTNASLEIKSEVDPSRLLQSILERTQKMETDLEELHTQRDQHRQETREREELFAKLLDYKRTAFRNQMALHELP